MVDEKYNPDREARKEDVQRRFRESKPPYFQDVNCIKHPGNDLALFKLNGVFKKIQFAQTPIVMIGPNGSGKSLIVSALMKKLAENAILTSCMDVAELSTYFIAHQGASPNLGYMTRSGIRGVFVDSLEHVVTNKKGKDGEAKDGCAKKVRSFYDNMIQKGGLFMGSFSGDEKLFKKAVKILMASDESRHLGSRLSRSKKIFIHHPYGDRREFFKEVLKGHIGEVNPNHLEDFEDSPEYLQALIPDGIPVGK